MLVKADEMGLAVDDSITDTKEEIGFIGHSMHDAPTCPLLATFRELDAGSAHIHNLAVLHPVLTLQHADGMSRRASGVRTRHAHIKMKQMLLYAIISSNVYRYAINYLSQHRVT